jgi:hypothetical protein
MFGQEWECRTGSIGVDSNDDEVLYRRQWSMQFDTMLA